MAKRITKDRTQVQLFQVGKDNFSVYDNSSTYNQSHFANRISAMEAVIQKLKDDDLKQGHCFMLTDPELLIDQAYYLYPNGRIKIEQVNLKNIEIPRTVIKVLNRSESEAIIKKHAFLK